MEVSLLYFLDDLVNRYPILEECRDSIFSSYEVLKKTFVNNNRLYVCGNGGSAADALHIAGELAKSFVLMRNLDQDFVNAINDSELSQNLQGALPAFALVENTALTTAFANDCNPQYVFAQQVYAYARKGDCFMGLSTSGNSVNIMNACKAAKARGASTIGLTGKQGGELKVLCDVCICVPEIETYKIQELHLPVYHTLCLLLEYYFWGEDGLWKQ